MAKRIAYKIAMPANWQISNQANILSKCQIKLHNKLQFYSYLLLINLNKIINFDTALTFIIFI